MCGVMDGDKVDEGKDKAGVRERCGLTIVE